MQTSSRQRSLHRETPSGSPRPPRVPSDLGRLQKDIGLRELLPTRGQGPTHPGWRPKRNSTDRDFGGEKKDAPRPHLWKSHGFNPKALSPETQDECPSDQQAWGPRQSAQKAVPEVTSRPGDAHVSPTGRGLATRTATAHSGLSHSTRHGVGGRHLHKLQGTHTVLEQFGEQFGMILGRFNMYLPRTHTCHGRRPRVGMA